MKILGYLLLGIGIAIIFGAVFLALSFYSELTEKSSNINSLPQTQDISYLLNELLNKVNTYLGLGVYLTVKAIILFVLVEAGFKISQLGLNIVKDNKK
jgi:delta-aminolevulinic acid dehydratase/porphobilinogen synthase